MSFYNLLHGYNPNAVLLSLMLKLKIHASMDGTPVGRFRDIYLNEDGTEIHLLTRNGGGNRECWDSDRDSDECTCPGCVQEQILPNHPFYISDADDDFDGTFAITKFNVPPEHLELTRSLSTGEKPESLQEKTMSAISAMTDFQTNSETTENTVASGEGAQ